MAYHFQQAGDDRAVEWLVKAGERAGAAYAWITAADRFAAALALLPEEQAAERGWLIYRMARMRRFSHPYQSRDLVEEAIACGEQAGDRVLVALARFNHGVMRAFFTREGRAGLAEMAIGADEIVALDEADRARLQATPGVSKQERVAPHAIVIQAAGSRGELAYALTVAERWLPADADALEWAQAWMGLGIAYAQLGRPADARVAVERTLRCLSNSGHHLPIRATNLILLYFVVLPYETERLGERQDLLERIVAAGRRASGATGAGQVIDAAYLRFIEARWDDPSFALCEAIPMDDHGQAVLFSRCVLARRDRERGRRDEAWGWVRQIFPAGPGTELDDTFFAMAIWLQATAVMLSLDAGDLKSAQVWLAAHDRWLAWSGAVWGQSELQALSAQYHRAVGDIDQAGAHAQQALAHATDPRQPLALIAAHRLLAELATDAGRFAEAATHLDAALALADACAAPYERALTLLAIAELRATTGDVTDAVAALDAARTICAPLGAKPALARADALAARLSAEPIRPSQYPAGLSAREVEVLRLVAAGLTNVQVGERLFLSPRTVEQHLRSIFNKTGATSRTAASRFATEHHLI